MGRQGGGGSLQIATVPTFATRWLLPRLPDFARQCPDVTVHLETRTRPFLFADTPFDAALYAGTPEQVARWPGTRTTLLMPEDVVPVASPALLGTRKRWRPADIAHAPLLQQSTRPEMWRQWFDAMGVDAPDAMRGPRYELFSMLAVAAAHGLGFALMPTMLIDAELARGELLVAAQQPLRGQRSYYLVAPEAADERPTIGQFRDWLLQQAAGRTAGAAAAGRG
jgi:DNA-binding transcriptional LysR family regulator